ncbi:hypothetical protein Acr_17g0010600 [Actinidia rufa]|uniref:Uncharacterized protein n=1 Tax=Actinidia rufa TaxID=165716 RepID=A0A7J0G3Z6_9ERIC|nr:hypothetical protein Acr_17g0010600 [Actinidia rufa]
MPEEFLSGITPAGNVCFLAQVAKFSAVCGNNSSQYSMHLRSHLLPRQSINSSLDNRAHLMANAGQASDLEGIHREMHGIAKLLINLAVLTNRAIRIRRIVVVLVRDM